MVLTPKIHGQDLKVVTLTGPSGDFGIAYAGSRPEGGHGFYYQAEGEQFFFYAQLKTEPAMKWVVTGAQTRAWSGAPFRTYAQKEPAKRANIEFFFHTRRCFSPEQPGDASSQAMPVEFTWR